MSADEQNRQSDLAVMDANEYKQKRRLRRILDAQDAVEERAASAYELYVAGDISEDGKNIIILRAVRELIRETYNLLVEYYEDLDEDEDAVDYWSGRHLGTLEREHAKDIAFNGLRDVLHAEKMYFEEWQEQQSARHGPDSTQARSRSYTVPEDVSWRAYLLVKEFLAAEHDLEIRFEELDDSLPTWGFEELDEDVEGTEDLSNGDS